MSSTEIEKTYIKETTETIQHENEKDIDVDLSIVDAHPKDLKDKEDSDDDKKSDTPPPVPFYKLFQFADYVDKILILIGTLGAMANGAAFPIMSIIFSDFITAFANFALATYQHPDDLEADKKTLNHEVIKNVIYFIILGSSAFVASYSQMAAWMVAGERQTKRVRELYFAAIMRQEIGWFDAVSTGDLTTRISGDVNILQEGLSEKIGLIIQYLTTFLAGFVIGFVKGWKLALVICSVIPLLAAAGAVMSKSLASKTTRGQDAYAGAGTVAEQVFSGIRTVVAFGGQNREIQRYVDQLEIAYKTGKKKAFVSGAGLGTIFFIMFSTYGLAFWYGSRLILSGEKTGGQVLNTFFALLIGAFTIGNLAPHLSAVGNALGAAASLFAVIDRVPLIDVTSDEGKRLDKSTVKGKIVFKDVSFHYPQRPDVPVLKNFSLTIEPGQTVALVGSSGCGKSTIISLLERFYDPISGSIELDGEDIRDINIKSLRTQIGLVGQEPVLFPTTVRENIAWGGVPDEKEPKLDEIIEASKKANAHEFVDELPDKYNTLVGEKGALLSGGQKQRIAIARALIKDPAILLLDEATSALDTESERTVQAALDSAAINRTSIIVAHRLSTIKDADKIIVMSKGEIIDTGRHEELIARQGVYYQLVKAQELKFNQDDKKSEDEDEDESSVPSQSEDVILTVEEKRHRLRRTSTKASAISHRSDAEIRAEEEAAARKKKTPLGRVVRLNLPELPIIILGAIGACLFGAQMPVFSLVYSNILDTFSHTNEPDKLRHDANFWASMFVVLGATSFIGASLHISLFTLSGECLTKRIRTITFKALINKEIAFFDGEANGTGVLTSRLAVDASKVEGLTGSLAGTIIQTTASVVVGLTIAFVNGWKLTLVILASVPLTGLASLFQMRTLAGFGSKTRKAYEESGQIVQQGVSNMRTISSLNREETFKTLYHDAINEPHKLALKGSIFSSIGFGLAQGALYFTWSLAFWYGSRLVVNLEYTQKQMLNVLFAVVFTAVSLGQISSFAPNIAKAKVAAIGIFEIIDRKSAIDVTDTEDKDRPAPITGTASAQNVHFNYPARPDVTVLRGLDLSVLSGKTVAVVGSSGSGKSTIVSLILRYYDVKSGSVNVEDVDIRNWNLEYLRENMALVGQEPVLFDFTIRENIAYGKEGCTEEEIIEAAKVANIHNFVVSLPKGYDTRVGEKGTQLSGGQKQRIAIARAFIRAPKLMLMDEATSALDSESEHIVQDALDRAAKDRTTITIAHRLSTIQNADLIVVIKKGQVAEQGTHSELIAKHGLYFELVNKQTLMKN